MTRGTSTLRSWLAAVAAVALLGAVAGCGGGNESGRSEIVPIDGSGGSAELQLDTEDLIARGDSICAETNAAVQSIGTAGGFADAESVAEQRLDVVSGALARLESLEALSRGSAQLKSFLEAQRAVVDALEERVLALESGDDAGLAASEAELASAQSEAAEAAEAYGFRECGEPAEPAAAGEVPGPAGGGEVPATPVEAAAGEDPGAAPAPSSPPDTGGTGTADGGGAGTGSGPTGGSGGGSAGTEAPGSGGIGPGSGGVSP